MIGSKMLKTVILIGGPGKGTRFRPLSLDTPKPLFPVAGFPMIYHHIEAAKRVDGMKEIILIGSYQPNEALSRFITNVQHEFKILVRYLQEYTALGTAGGMYHFRDQILSGSPEAFFVMNCDVCGDFPLVDMVAFHRQRGVEGTHTLMATEATRQQSLNFGCIVENRETHEVCHFVEKPESFVSSLINCGVYLFSPQIFDEISVSFQKRQDIISERARAFILEGSFDYDYNNGNSLDVIRLEQDVCMMLAGAGKLFVYQTTNFWSQIKSAGAAVYANRHYLTIYHGTHPDRLATNGEGLPRVIGDVFIHPSATVHPSATLGPNVTIGKNVTVGAGVRVRESIVLEGATLKDHACILHSIVGWNSSIGQWSRVEGTPNDPNPNKPFAKLDIPEVFNSDGRLNPSITVIGSHVQIPGEVIVLNSIVLPNKELNRSYKNQIIL